VATGPKVPKNAGSGSTWHRRRRSGRSLRARDGARVRIRILAACRPTSSIDSVPDPYCGKV
jgi:hypothetical protein